MLRPLTIAYSALVLFALGTLLSGCGEKRKGAAPATTRSAQTKLEVLWQTRVGRYPVAAAYGRGSVWVASAAPAGVADGRLIRLDAVTGRVTANIPVGWSPSGLAEGAGGAWVADSVGDGSRSGNGLPGLENAVSRVDPRTNHVVATVHIPEVQSVAVGGGVIWATSALPGHETILRIDPSVNRAQPVLRLRGASGPLIWGGGRLWALTWVASPNQHARISMIDPATDRVRASIVIPGAGPLSALAYQNGAVWVSAVNPSSSSLRGRVFRIDTRRTPWLLGHPHLIAAAMSVALSRDGAWAAGDRVLSLLSAKSGVPIAHLKLPADVPPTTQSVTADRRQDVVWVLTGTRLEAVRMRATR